MPMSQAAIAGIGVNGLRWKHTVSLAGLGEVMGDMTIDTPDAEVEACAKAIVALIRAFTERLRVKPGCAAIADRINDEATDLEFVAGDGIEEVREKMTSIYDEFDFQRICVVS